MTHVTCRLNAKDRDQLRNPTLGNRVWATFTFTVQRARGITWSGADDILAKSFSGWAHLFTQGIQPRVFAVMMNY